jgi:serine/threonine protein kinase
VVSRQRYDKNVDWWALGIIIYEMLVGITPFYNKNPNQVFEKIKTSRPRFPDMTKYPITYSCEW